MLMGEMAECGRKPGSRRETGESTCRLRRPNETSGTRSSDVFTLLPRRDTSHAFLIGPCG